MNDISECIRKKRKSVAKTLGKILGAGVVVLAVCYALWLGLPTIIAGAEAVASLITTASTTVAAALLSVPLWCWVIMGIVAALAFGFVVYPWAWCVSREFTDEDKRHDSYGAFLCFVAIASIQAIISGYAGMLEIGIILYFVISLGGSVLNIVFVGPYLHYRRSIAQEEKEGEERVV